MSPHAFALLRWAGGGVVARPSMTGHLTGWHDAEGRPAARPVPHPAGMRRSDRRHPGAGATTTDRAAAHHGDRPPSLSSRRAFTRRTVPGKRMCDARVDLRSGSRRIVGGHRSPAGGLRGRGARTRAGPARIGIRPQPLAERRPCSALAGTPGREYEAISVPLKRYWTTRVDGRRDVQARRGRLARTVRRAGHRCVPARAEQHAGGGTWHGAHQVRPGARRHPRRGAESRVQCSRAERRPAGDLLVGADGIYSQTRAWLFGALPHRENPHHTYRWRGHFRLADTDVDPEAETEVFGGRAFFGTIPTGDGRAYWFASGPGINSVDDFMATLRVMGAHATCHGRSRPVPRTRFSRPGFWISPSRRRGGLGDG